MNLLLTLLALLLLIVSIEAPSCSKPVSPAPAVYAVIMGSPVLLLKPTDGWICRCLLLSRPRCSCVLDSITENGPKTMPQIPIYFDATIRSHYPEHVLGF